MPNFDFTIPAPRRSPVPKAVEDVIFDVKDVRITGATAYATDDLRALAAPVIGKSIHLSNLIAVAEAIEAKYRADGYVLSRALVPTQNVSDGVFQIQVIEGYVAAVSVQTTDSAARRRVEDLLAPVLASRPLRIAVLEQALLSANELPGTSTTALLRPSATEPGASDLVATVQTQPFTASISTDNRGGPSTGFWTLSVDTAFHSPFDEGGQMQLSASVDPASFSERRSVNAKYAIPLGWEDITASISGLVSHGEPAGTSAALHLVTNSESIGPRLSMPLFVDRQEKLTVDTGFTVQSSDVRGVPSHDEWRVFDVGLAWQNSAILDGVTNGNFDVAQGVPSLGATASESANLARPAGHTDFTKMTATLRRTQTIDGPLSAALTVSGQYALQALLTGEEVSYGGSVIGRGYDPAALTGDYGVGEALELRYDFTGLGIGIDSLQPYVYFDSAKVWSHTGAVDGDHIASVGGGVRSVIMGNFSLALECGRTLIPVPGSENGNRSSRVMVNASVRF
jgi:hemolysin activation/secretion protein